MGPKLGLRLIHGYKRFDTSLICTRTHGSTVNWRFNVRFKLFLTYNTYNYPVLDLNNFFFPMKTIESLECGQYAGAAYLRVNTVNSAFCMCWLAGSIQWLLSTIHLHAACETKSHIKSLISDQFLVYWKK